MSWRRVAYTAGAGVGARRRCVATIGGVTDRVLTTRALNRALLARQLLLERSALPVPAALEQIGGIQDQYAPSGYIGLWSRLRTFALDDLTRALEERDVVQATLMRSTIHLVSASDYPLLSAGIRRLRREWWARARAKDLAGVDMDHVAGVGRAFLTGSPRRQAEIVGHLAASGLPKVAWDGLGGWLDLVRVPPSGTWARRRADLYGLADEWIDMPDVPEDVGLEHVVRRYLGGFGPAAIADIASWAGLPPTAVKPIVERLGLRRFRDEAGRQLFDVDDAPLPEADTPAPVRFLPTWDANLLVHARRTLVMPERFRPIVFSTKAPQSFPTFLVDGAVAGTWRFDAGRIELTTFEEIPASAMKALEREAERLAAIHESG